MKRYWGDIKPMDYLRTGFFVAAAFYFFAGNLAFTWKFFLAWILIMVVRWLQVPVWLELGFMIAGIFQVLGNNLELFQHYTYYDKLVHFTLPVFSGPLMYLLLVKNRIFEPNASQPKWGWQIFYVTAFTAITAAVLWEIVEFTVEREFHIPLQHGNTDTMTDLITSLLGAITGGYLAVLSKLGLK
ncbi:MAG TPA: hypothetical protein VLF21_01785 [Candidatus Saccharimonadales bacterium]|nr:hypothetical protein [Candidatus Saccharimonadales bacterium]